MRSRIGAALLLTVTLVACGARTGLPAPDEGEGGGGSAPETCTFGESRPCGSDVGVCKPGTETCIAGVFGPCIGAIGPFDEQCNDLDDDCDGAVDEDFGLGQACDGADNDLCADDVMTCSGCTLGPDILESCNGVDDNCNGIVDADCDFGDCNPKLVVTGSTPSSPSCIDFPVTKESSGFIEYPCNGGPVTANLDAIQFTGSVTPNGDVTLSGVKIIPPTESPDGCTWKTTHEILGNIHEGKLNYFYSEEVIVQGGPLACWQPCTELGDVKVEWVAAP
ncbi:MAG: hypothetical protein U0414_29970 [Polyangiaceae bacterium]